MDGTLRKHRSPARRVERAQLPGLVLVVLAWLAMAGCSPYKPFDSAAFVREQYGHRVRPDAERAHRNYVAALARFVAYRGLKVSLVFHH